MTLNVSTRRAEIKALCARFRVSSLYLFGSAVKGTMNDESDLDFLVEFDAPEVPGYYDRFFGLLEGLEDLLGRPVDLVVESAIRNPYFRESVENSRVLLYAA